MKSLKIYQNTKFKMVLALILLISICVCGISYNNKKKRNKEQEVSINFASEEVQIMVENVLNEPKKDFGNKDVQRSFNRRLSAFYCDNWLINEDGIYNLRNGESRTIDEGMLKLFLMVYLDKEDTILKKEDIEKCLSEGNSEKEEDIAKYVKWYHRNFESVLDIKYAYNSTRWYSENGQSLKNINGERNIDELSDEELKVVYEKLKDIKVN